MPVFDEPLCHCISDHALNCVDCLRMKELYTKEEVEELLREQKRLCSEIAMPDLLNPNSIMDRITVREKIINAPQPEMVK